MTPSEWQAMKSSAAGLYKEKKNIKQIAAEVKKLWNIKDRREFGLVNFKDLIDYLKLVLPVWAGK